MNVSRIFKIGEKVTLGALTIIALSSNATAETLLKQPLKQTKTYEQEVDILARNIYHEARGQSLKGQYAVGIVTINRVESGKFASSIGGVVRQPGQFSWYTKKQPKIHDVESFERAKLIAENIITKRGSLYHEVVTSLRGSLYFNRKDIQRFSKKRIITRIDDHLFYI